MLDKMSNLYTLVVIVTNSWLDPPIARRDAAFVGARRFRSGFSGGLGGGDEVRFMIGFGLVLAHSFRF